MPSNDIRDMFSPLTFNLNTLSEYNLQTREKGTYEQTPIEKGIREKSSKAHIPL